MQIPCFVIGKSCFTLQLQIPSARAEPASGNRALTAQPVRSDGCTAELTPPKITLHIANASSKPVLTSIPSSRIPGVSIIIVRLAAYKLPIVVWRRPIILTNIIYRHNFCPASALTRLDLPTPDEPRKTMVLYISDNPLAYSPNQLLY